MADERQETENREDRDRERSDEAHWRVAEEGAEDEPKRKTEKGPVAKRDDLLSNRENASRPDDSAIR